MYKISAYKLRLESRINKDKLDQMIVAYATDNEKAFDEWVFIAYWQVSLIHFDKVKLEQWI